MTSNIIFNLKMIDPVTNQPWTVICDKKENSSDKILVSFYDDRYPDEDSIGQFVSTYYAETLASHHCGLDLYSSAPGWKVSATFMKRLSALIQAVL